MSENNFKPYILWLTENYPPRRGGMAQACDRIVASLRKEGIHVDVAFFNASANGFKTTCQINGKLIAIPVSDSPAHSLNLLFNYINDPSNGLKYTHVVAFGGTAPMLALPIYKNWLGVKAVTLLRGNDFDTGVFQPAKRQILLDALKVSDAVCVLHSEAMKRVSALVPETNVYCISNGIDTDDWLNDSYDLEVAASFRQENNITDDQLLIGLFGQLKEKKGVVFFLENLLRTGLQEKIVILTVGDVEPVVQSWIDEKILGKTSIEIINSNNEETNDSTVTSETNEGFAMEKEQMKSSIDELSLKIIQLPFKDRFELLSLYPACDYIALPSHYDGMPNVLLEAGALGIPAIAARTGGIFQVLPPEQYCLTFYPGNSNQCREAVNRAAELSKQQRRDIGNALKNYIANNFNLRKESEAYKHLFYHV